MHFYNLGPVRSPKSLDPSWRELIGKLVARLCGIPNVDKDSRETWAVALAYDYVDYCGYRGVDLDWMSEALEILAGEELRNGDKMISWEGPSSDVSISFRAEFTRQRPWAEAPELCGLDENYSEFHRGVFLNIRL